MVRDDIFRFVDYGFDPANHRAFFRYSCGELEYCETLQLQDMRPDYDAQLLDSALFLAWILVGTSYYKVFPTSRALLDRGELDEWQVRFFDTVYQEGLSQFAYENGLRRDDLAHFDCATADSSHPRPFHGEGLLLLQSGGKDSLLVAQLLAERDRMFTPWHVLYGATHPAVLGNLGRPLRQARRQIDLTALREARANGGLNGHVPVTYIMLSYALIDAIIGGYSAVVVSIGHEGEEPHAWTGDMPINHQWSKTWLAERQFADYVARYVTPDIKVGSPLRRFSELKIAELFASHAWANFGHSFSSCNQANYGQGADNSVLKWCGECPKCANSFLLFAPFVDPSELMGLFGGRNLFLSPKLEQVFRGLLGIGDTIKPFECVGEIAELRLAYHMARQRWPRAGYELPFAVPPSDFDYQVEYESQSWVRQLI